MKNINDRYEIAKQIYKEHGIDTDAVLERMRQIPLSIHCWQLDDVQGFENKGQALTGGIQVTGNYPGKPTSVEAFRQHLKKVLKRIPGKKRLNLHASYLDTDEQVDRDRIEPRHFAKWVAFAKEQGIGLDFNPTCFSHPMSEGDRTLSSPDERVRRFWIDHVKQSRKIGEYFGKELGQRTITNIWVPDGSKEVPIDTLAPRKRLKESLDEIFAEPIDPKYNVDSLESKLFGIGTESYVVGSHEFYTNYVASTKNGIICLDAGHYHPTEVISKKLTAYLAFNQEIVLHVSRPVRWDSDHVVLLDDETQAIMREIARQDAFDRIHVGLDFFDGTINRIAATVVGARNARKAMLQALLENTKRLKTFEEKDDFTSRLVEVEENKTLPFGFVWDYYCTLEGVPAHDWYEGIEDDE
jgi:L-rhamnose isomerase